MEYKSSNDAFLISAFASLSADLIAAIASLASRSVFTTLNVSPGFGTPSSPRISTGVLGPAFLRPFPAQSNNARVFPHVELKSTMSPDLSVPSLTITVATGPLPLSRRASITTPSGFASGLPLSSCISASSKTRSKRSGTPIPCFAEISTAPTSPPQPSVKIPSSLNCWRTRSGFAPCLSILLIATTRGTPAALMWLMASRVCGITPSSAPITRITMSVTLAPLARISVNASCPGVSRNTICLPS